MSYKPAGDELWVVGSIPGKRYIMALNASLKNSTNTTSTSPPQSTVTVKLASSGMEPGSIAGVSLGVLLGVGAALTGILLLLRRRRQKAIAESQERVYTKPELGSTERTDTGASSEESAWAKELGGDIEKYELPGKAERYELYSGETAKELPMPPPPAEISSVKWS